MNAKNRLTRALVVSFAASGAIVAACDAPERAPAYEPTAREALGAGSMETGVWKRVPSPGLTQRAAAAAAYDPVRDQLILFGGDAREYVDSAIGWQYRGETWSFDGDEWTRRSDVGPSPRQSARMAWDPIREVIVLFGGVPDGRGWSGSEKGNDTWEWDGSSWTGRSADVLPSVIDESALATFQNAVVMVGRTNTGTSSCTLETRTWNGSGWTLLAPDNPPACFTDDPYAPPLLVADQGRDRLVLWARGSSVVYEWNGDDWGPVNLTQPFPSTMSERDCAAGYAAGKVTFVCATGTELETWTYDGAEFDLVETASGPTFRTRSTVAVDTSRDRLILVGGMLGNNSSDPLTSDTWAYDDSGWTRLALDGAPSMRTAATVYDPVRRRTLFYGGGPGDELWSYDGTRFRLESKSKAFACATGAFAVWDSAREVMHARCSGLGVSFIWDGAWSVESGGPGSVYAAAYDEARDAMLFLASGAAGAELWEFSSSSTSTRSLPSAFVDLGLMAFDRASGLTLLTTSSSSGDIWTYDGTSFQVRSYGNAWTSPTYFDTFRGRLNAGGSREWQGDAWTSIDVEGQPNSLGPLAFDEQRGVALFLGELGDIFELRLRGSACSDDDDCPSGHCVNNACCESASCGPCEACNVPGAVGVCSPATGQSDPESCAAPLVCGPTGACGAPDGHSCDDGGACASGRCTDGVCCDTDCVGGCNRCDLPARLGRCTAVSTGDPGSDPSCAPFACTGGQGCPSSCASDADCAGGGVTGFCLDGDCILRKAPGEACDDGAECGSGFCSEGLCCTEACDDLCQSCTKARTGLADGRCGDIEDGAPCGTSSCEDARVSGRICLGGACEDGSLLCAPFECATGRCASTCSDDGDCVDGSDCVDGTCTGATLDGLACARGSDCQSGHCVDGVCCESACDESCEACRSDRKADGSKSGECGQARAGVACGATTCAPGAGLMSGQLCNAAGDCVASSLLCLPYRCDDEHIACSETCADDDACEPGFACQSGRCRGTLTPGDGCGFAEQCASGRCVDGVCCERACDGACERCDLTGHEGECAPVPAGEEGDPLCAPYVCGGSSGDCPEACEDDDECAKGLPCVDGECERREQGDACRVNDECKSGHCVDGVCCESSCTGCRACSILARGYGDEDGVCGPVLDGYDPHDACDAEPASTCGRDGTCNGEGSCRRHPAGSACDDDTKCQGDYVIGHVCDGRGTCIETPPAGIPCAPYACAGGACSIPCGECLPGTYCDEGTCRPNLDRGDECRFDAQCRDGHCVDGVCCNDACGGACSACDVPDHEGTCTPIERGERPRGERKPCDGEGSACAGSCDGKGKCEYPDRECDSSCAEGVEVVSSCVLGSCVPSADATTCGNYACDSARGHCRTDCVSEADCAVGFDCNDGACTPKPNGVCLDGVSLRVTADDRVVNCIAYRCEAGRCLEACASADDCQDGFVCDSQKRCILARAAASAGAKPADDGGCGCRSAGGDSRRTTGLSLALLALTALARRQRRNVA